MTSVTRAPDGSLFALAYLRCKSRGEHQELEGREVQVNTSPARVVGIPFATRSFPEGAAPDSVNPVVVAQAPSPSSRCVCVAESACPHVISGWTHRSQTL